MHITSRYVGTSMENFNYLFFLLTEDYIEEHLAVQETLSRALVRFGRSIGDKGALVRPFPGDESATFEDFADKGWSEGQLGSVKSQLPSIFIIDVAFTCSTQVAAIT